MGEVVEPRRGVGNLPLAIVLDHRDGVRRREAFDQLPGNARDQALVGFDDQIHAGQGRRNFRIQQMALRAFDVAQHQHPLVGIGRKICRFEQRTDADAVTNAVLGCQRSAGFLRLGVEIEGPHAGMRHPPRHPHRVIAFGTANVEDGRVVRLDGLLDVGQQRLLVAAKQLGDVAAFGRLRQEIQAFQRPGHHHGALLLQHRVLDQHAAPLRQQAQDTVEVSDFFDAGFSETINEALPDIRVESHLIARFE